MALVFVHIPKTAGRTLNEAALSSAPDRAVVVDTEEQLDARLRGNKSSELPSYIGGHFRLSFAKELIADTMGDRSCQYVSVLRDPVARAYSFYLFLLRVKNAIPHVSAAIVDRDFEFFLDFMYEYGEWHLRDAQCWLLGGKRSAEAAIQIVETELTLLGVTEKFDQFYTKLQHLSQFPFPDKISVLDRNVAPVANALTEMAHGYKPENWRNQVSRSALRKLERINQEDFILYDYAQRRGGLIVNDRRLK